MSDCLLLNDSPAVSPPPAVQTPPSLPSQHFISRANALELAKKGHAAKRSIIEKRISDAVKQAVQAVHAEYAQKHAELLARMENHPNKSLIAVRAELDRTYLLLSQTVEPKAHAALSASISKLTDVERVLDGRPLPGQLRPFQPRAKKGADTTPGPVE